MMHFAYGIAIVSFAVGRMKFSDRFTTKKGWFTTSLFIWKNDMPKEKEREIMLSDFRETDFKGSVQGGWRNDENQWI